MKNAFYWSVRRELWENRSIYWAPIATAGVALLMFLFTSGDHIEDKIHQMLPLSPEMIHQMIAGSYSGTGYLVLIASVIVGWVYCLEALHGERSDRSILFWKSLPVSDRTTVLSKASVPFIVLPATAFVVGTVSAWVTLVCGLIFVAAAGLDTSLVWNEVYKFQQPVALLYSLAVVTLWQAPIYGWLMLVSSWARRSVLLWALLPPLAIALLETLVFKSTHFLDLLKQRFTIGGISNAYTSASEQSSLFVDRIDRLDPLRYLATSGVWIGLAFAIVFIALAVRLRRYHDPI